MQQALLLLHTDSHSPLAFHFLTHTTCFVNRLWFSDFLPPSSLVSFQKKNQKKETGPLTTSDAISYHVAELVWKLRIQASHNERASASEQVQHSARASERARERDTEKEIARQLLWLSPSWPSDLHP
jgi:hypothetical protein